MLSKKETTTSVLKNAARAGLAIMLAVVIVSVFSRKIDVISNAMQQKRSVSLLLQKRIEASANLRTGLEQIGDGDEKIKQALPPKENILDFVAAMESLASAHSLPITEKFGSPVPAGGDAQLFEIPYSLVLSGTLPTMTAFLKDFEKLSYFASITSMTADAKSPSGWDGDTTLTIQAKVFAR